MLLGSGKAEVESALGKSSIARSLLDMPDEKVSAHRVGPFDVTVSYIGGLARAMAVRRSTGPQTPLAFPELSAALAINAPAALWEIKSFGPAEKTKTASKAASAPRAVSPPTTYFSFAERDPKNKEKVGAEIFGWMPGDKSYAFFFLPALAGQPHVLASEWAVRGKLG